MKTFRQGGRNAGLRRGRKERGLNERTGKSVREVCGNRPKIKMSVVDSL